MINAAEAVKKASIARKVIPAYNAPFPEMIEPIVRAIADENSIGMIQVARIEWEKFGAISPETIAKEYHRVMDSEHTLLHLDHIPVIDEDGSPCDYMSVIKRAINCGYESVMVDGSRLPFKENVKASELAVSEAHIHNIPCEAELGKVSGHESGPRLPYEQIFKERIGFTNAFEASEFVRLTGCDWLSIAAGSVHGSVAESLKFEKKPDARLDIEHIKNLHSSAGIPLVLHGGSGIGRKFIHQGVCAGISKINIGTEIRQAYLRALEANGYLSAANAVYEKVRLIISEELEISGLKTLLFS